MKKRQHMLPCGRVIIYKELGPKDLAMKKGIHAQIVSNRKEFEGLVSYNTAGRNIDRYTERVFNKFTTLLVKKLVDHLMESDRVQTDEGRFWVIGGVQETDGRHVNWHTDGLSFGVGIQGLPGNYRISMKKSRRKELQRRIEKGQVFHRL